MSSEGMKKLKIRRYVYSPFSVDKDGKFPYTEHDVNFYGQCEECKRVYQLSDTINCIVCFKPLTPF